MKKPKSVQFKFLEDLKTLTDPTEPRIRTIEIPAQHQKKLSKRVKRHRAPILMPLTITVVALALCACLLLLIVLHH